MSPEGVYDKAAQIKSLGSRVLYNVNQGQIPLGEAVDEQLKVMGIKPADLDYVLLTHLDCDHANGLRAVKDAKHIIVAQEELDCARKNGFIRYKKKWWEGVDLQTIEWNGTEGPAQKSFDLFGNGSIKMINILARQRDAAQVAPVDSRTVNGCQLHREPCHSRHRHQTARDRVVGLALLTVPVWSAVVIACFCLLPPRRVPHSSWVC